jgi:uncharacterized protein (DUF111 family)
LKADTLVIRTPCGLSGDMLLCGLARLLDLDAAALEQRVARVGVPALAGALQVLPRTVGGITGWTARVTLPHEHAHRGLAEILAIIDAGSLAPAARAVARRAFVQLAEVEAEMHGIAVEEVHFHEIGALDSILDVCLVAELHAELGSPAVTCSPLPVSDGVVRCDHGLLATPAPAVLRMLEGVPVYGVADAGETVTPTALGLLLAMDARFGLWPPMTIARTARAYGTREFTGVPNGALFAAGSRASARGPSRAQARGHDQVHGHVHIHGDGHDHDHDHDHDHAADAAHPRA